jgi:hypothetical protein
MRIRIIQKPAVAFIDGVRLDNFRPGSVYQFGSLMAGVFLAEGWAEPVDDPESGDQPTVDVPAIPRNLTREFFPPYYDGSPAALAAEQASRRRARRRRK